MSFPKTTLLICTFFLLGLLSVPSAWCVTPTASTYYFPQAVDGVSGNTFYSTTFTISNPITTANTVNIRFYRSDASPWVIDLRSFDRGELTGHVSSSQFALQAGETVNLFTGGIDSLVAGWVRIQSTGPILASEVFQVLSRNTTPFIVNWEAGVLPAPVSTRFSFLANVASNEPTAGTNITTGYAIANPSENTTQIIATLYSRSGPMVAQKTFTLDPNTHTAQFLPELFDNYRFPAVFHGYVSFTSSVNVAIVALRSAAGPIGDVYSAISVTPSYTQSYNIAYDIEDNSSILKAQYITPPVRIIGTVNSPSDGAENDYFSVYLEAGQTLYVLSVGDLMGSSLNGYMNIYNPSGGQVGSVDDFAAPLRDPFDSYTADVSGLYYIRLTSTGGTYGRTAHYELLVKIK
jgi:hypothetical protein